MDLGSESGVSDILGTAPIFLKDDRLHPNNVGEVMLKNYMQVKYPLILHYRQ